MAPLDDLKQAAALAALAHVRSNSVIGLGTGSTARLFVAALGAALARGELVGVAGVPTSEETAAQARSLGIEVVELPPEGLELAVDGMDEITPELDAIKGLGGAMTREKIVAAAARTLVLIGDEGKEVDRLGARAPLPVEVLPFGAERTAAALAALFGGAGRWRLRGDERFVSDNGAWILDLPLAAHLEPQRLAATLDALPGVVDHGLFLGMARFAYVATESGVRRLERRG